MRFDAVFPGFRNDINEEVGVENITSFELCYGFRTYGLRVDLNVYSTSWKDRWISRGVTLDGGIDGTAQFAGVGQLHQGIELEVTARPTDNLRLQGMMSLGSWKYTENVTANVFDDNNQQVGSSTLFIEDVKVGDAAQTTFFAEAQYELFEKFNIDLGWRHAANLYADFDVAQDDIFLEADNAGALELPSYSLVDLGLDYTFDFGGSNLFARLNVNNVFDTVYIAESETNFHATTDSALYDGIDTSNFVWFGFGTTWNVTLRYNF